MKSYQTNPARRRILTTAVGLWLSNAVVQAHPGHGLTDVNPTHLVTSPDHVAILLFSATLLFLGGRAVQQRWRRRLLQSAGMLALAGAGIVWGLHA